MNIKEALELADHDDPYVLDGTITCEALQTLAAAYRELTTLRPMSEAPTDGTQFNVLIQKYNEWTGEKYDDEPTWHCAFYSHGDYLHIQQAVDRDGVSHKVIGWLPLPEVKV